LLFFCIFLYYLISLTKQKKELNEDEKPKFKLWKSLLFVLIGLGGIILGSDLVVNNASDIAKNIGLSERVIALTVIAFGTSLPELVTTIVSAKKGEQDLLIGNIIGSNIFNICVVLGIPVVIFGTISPTSFQMLDLILLILSSFMLWLFAETKRTITRWQGITMLLVFAIYYVLVFVI
jgi:cation:H+ antiporter